MNRYTVMYTLGLAPWERRRVEETWRRLFERPDAPAPGRALDVGCGSGRDAVYLAKQGWQVTGVDFIDKALGAARQRAAEEAANVEFVKGDVGELGSLGLEPGYMLLYDFGCLHGLPDDARRGAAEGLTQLAAPGATLLLGAFMKGRRLLLPRGMDQEDVVALFGDGWQLQEVESAVTDEMPPPVRRAEPTAYRFTRRG